jgi:eukaryotic-like serine/threonine-protein kinase
MSDERWRRIEEMFHQAVDLPLRDRAEFLGRACAGDGELRREVESLLEGDKSHDDLLHAAVANAVHDLPSGAQTGGGNLAGRQIGPYLISGLIGKGGMGEVYRARDTRLNRDVALKVLPADLAQNETRRRRFEHEARLVATLSHPHICRLYDVGPGYLVFEYIDGAPLKGPLPSAEALRIALEIADALDEAHEHGIVHRDLKPSNILLTKRGTKVLDFGIAKQNTASASHDDKTAATATDLTLAGEMVGTPGYMAPEQLIGGPTDARTDIYAFGCVLYEMLAGERIGPARKPLQSSALEAIVRRCLADDPGKRFQSAADLKNALASVAGKSGGWVRYAVAAVAFLALVVGAAFFWQQRVHAKPKLTDQDVLVVADFDNKTGDTVFDTALKQALAFQLQESPFLKAMDEEEVRDTLKRSGRSPDAHVTGEIARDICIREGQKATLEGSIAALGSRYLIALQAVNCQTGETFAREEAEANGKEHVVEALAKATTSMRSKLGDSMSAIQGENRAYENAVTTTSLDALQSFYMGDEEYLKGGSSQTAIPFYRHAVELDPNFAFAYAVLAVLQHNVQDFGTAKETSEKAFLLKDRVTYRERLFIEYAYHYVRGDKKETLETGELLSRRYPRDAVFHSNLAVEYFEADEPEKALLEAQAALKNNPRIVQGYLMTQGALIALNRGDEAKSVLRKAIENGFDIPAIHSTLLYLASAEDDTAAQAREAQWLNAHQGQASALREQANGDAARGHLTEAEKLFRQGAAYVRDHPSGLSSQKLLGEAWTAGALFGKCASPGAQVPLVRKTLCDPAAAKKLAQERPNAALTGPDGYARGAALLAAGQASDAAALFSKMVDQKFVNWGPEYPAAQVGLARAAKTMGDAARAKKSYEQFFAFWKDADPDIPILIQAKAEYAKLK